MSDAEDKFETWLWNNIANESDSDIDEGEDSDENELDLEVEESKKVCPEVCKEIK